MSKIREAANTDEEAVFNLAVNITRDPPIEREMFHGIWLNKLHNETSYVAIAELEGVVVGYISGYLHSTLYSNNPIAWVDEIVVKEGARKRGIGKKMMGNFINWASENESRLVALASHEGDAFYRSLGYKEDVSKYYTLEVPK
jgi:GNAT superfamily N-acetyltransferase